MKLWDMLECAMHFQPFSVYITNAYDQNLLIGRGTRSEMMDANKTSESVFSHLMDDIDYWVLGADGKRVLIFIRNKDYDRPLEELFSLSNRWGSKPNERPWRYSIETERYTDKYICVVDE
jgi:hypothetical protein